MPVCFYPDKRVKFVLPCDRARETPPAFIGRCVSAKDRLQIGERLDAINPEKWKEEDETLNSIILGDDGHKGLVTGVEFFPGDARTPAQSVREAVDTLTRDEKHIVIYGILNSTVITEDDAKN